MRSTDESLMRRAIAAAGGNPSAPFAALLAVDDEVIAAGLNSCRAQGPIWHGEIDCLNNAAAANFDNWSNATLVTTAEPCPMCMSAILWAGVGRVAYGSSVPTLVERGWNQFSLRATDIVASQTFSTCEVIADVLADQCDRLFPQR